MIISQVVNIIGEKEKQNYAI